MDVKYNATIIWQVLRDAVGAIPIIGCESDKVDNISIIITQSML